MSRLLERVFVWLGGGMFVVALVVTGWSYAFWFGEDRPWAGIPPIVGNVLIFSVFALHHSLLARDTAKRVMARAIPDRLLRSVYVYTASVLLILVCMLWAPVGGLVYDNTALWARSAHIAVQLTGFWLVARSVGGIDALVLAGIRSQPGPAAGGLQVVGPYRFVRHPLYLGWILIVFGASHMTGDRFLFACVSTFYLVIAIPWEERSLGQTFGAEYAAYRQRVRWRVLPFIY